MAEIKSAAPVDGEPGGLAPIPDTVGVRDAADQNSLTRHYRWNSWAFGIDMAMFSVGISFVSSTTVLPSLLVTLGASALIVGLASALTTGGWLLPQLIIASAVARLPYKKPIIVYSAWAGRTIMLLIALAVWRLGVTRADLTVIIVLASMFLFFVVDALVSVPWFDLLARALPPLRRGRILGLAQVLGGLGGIGAGMFVRYALGDASPWHFPDNYALLYVLAFVGITGSTVALSLIREPRSAALETREIAGFGAIMASLPGILANDRPFTRLIAIRVAGGFVTMASAFYILFATQELGLALSSTGLFVSAQVVGSLTSGLVMGALQDRWGPRIHMRVMMLISMAPPLLALAMRPLAAALGPAVLYPYLLVFFFMGIYMSNTGWPYFNWILEYAPEMQRPLYIGIINTLAALTMLAPALGGWLITVVNYPAVFITALAFAGLALALSTTLPSTRQVKPAQGDTP